MGEPAFYVTATYPSGGGTANDGGPWLITDSNFPLSAAESATGYVTVGVSRGDPTNAQKWASSGALSGVPNITVTAVNVGN
jgi:hypothetical protein